MSAGGRKAYTLRQKAGAAFLDLPRLCWALHGPAGGDRWVRYGNRRDHLRVNPHGEGVACAWESTRTLHLCNVFPWTGRMLLSAALRRHPIRFMETPDSTPTDAVLPEVSFIIGHRGQERLPQLLLTLRSIAAQQGVRCECIVVEQDVSPQIRDHLPDWVRYVHDPVAGPHAPYCRSRAFNAGAASARGRLLVLHDNDLLVPDRYAESAWTLAGDGYEVINLKRFIFYASEGIQAGPSFLTCDGLGNVKSVLENATGGGSLALDREAFEAIGRMDESFEGWGGEDVEFWQRAMTRRVWNYGFLPLVHLWHPDQPGKAPEKNTPGMARLRLLSAMSPAQRIAALRRQRGGAA